MKRSACIILWALAIVACHNPKVKTNVNEDDDFAIEGTMREVVKTFPDGAVKLALFIDENSKQKVAEVEFHQNGSPKIDKRFRNDTLQGESWCYYENGNPWSLNTFKDGVNQGPYKTWHENGQLYIQGQFENGLKTGEWFTYYSNGTLNTRGFYQYDEKVGIWNSYNLEGTMKREQDFGTSNSK